MDLNIFTSSASEIQEALSETLYKISAAGHILELHEAKKPSFPLKRKNLSSKTFLDVIPPSRWLTFRESVSRLTHGEEHPKFKFFLICDKVKYWYNVTICWADNYNIHVKVRPVKHLRRKKC